MNPQPTGRLRGKDLVLTRRFRASVEDVWTSITDSNSTARWFGAWEGKPGVGNEIRVQMAFEEGKPWLSKKIEACEAPHRLVLCSINSPYVSKLELLLKTTNEGCELEFIQHAIDPKMVGDMGPGWEYYLDALVASRDNAPHPSFSDYHPGQKPYYAGLAAE